MTTCSLRRTLVICGLGVVACAAGAGGPKHAQSEAVEEQEESVAAPAGSTSSTAEEPPDVTGDADTTSSGGKGPVEFAGLRGPMQSLDEYRKERGAEWDSSCGAPPHRPKHGVVRAGGRGKIRSVEVIRVPSQVSCAPVEHCALAFRTDEGWFVRDEDSPCDGAVGGSNKVQRKDERLVWIDVGDVHVLEYRYSVVATQSSQRTEQESSTPLQGPTTHESENMEETKWLVLCGAGASGKPGCTGRLVTSCPGADGEMRTVTWKYEEKKVILDSPEPNHECRGDITFVLGSFALDIP